jgi:hypothetical protein
LELYQGVTLIQKINQSRSARRQNQECNPTENLATARDIKKSLKNQNMKFKTTTNSNL